MLNSVTGEFPVATIQQYRKTLPKKNTAPTSARSIGLFTLIFSFLGTMTELSHHPRRHQRQEYDKIDALLHILRVWGHARARTIRYRTTIFERMSKSTRALVFRAREKDTVTTELIIQTTYRAV